MRIDYLRTGKLHTDVGGFDTLARVVFMPDGKRLLAVRHGCAEIIDPKAIPRR